MAELFGAPNPSANRRRSSITGGNSGARGGGAPGGKAPAAVQNNVFRIPSNIDVSLGLQWGFIGDDPVDLDASCVAFDEQGNCLEAVFFNHLKAEKGYMEHTGDNTTGEDDGDDDESIVFHMSLIPKDVHYMMVCVTSYTGANFTLVDSANVRLVNLATKEVVGAFSLGVIGHHTASLLCAFSRVSSAPDEGGLYWWDMREINIACAGYTFCDLLPQMLKLLAVPVSDHEARLMRLPDYSLEKVDDTQNMVLSQLKFGLGWDGENDLDASLVMVDAQGRYVDHVYAKFGKLRSHVQGPTATELMARVTASNLAIAAGAGAPPAELKAEKKAAVIHSGDKLNGFDVEGDDEFIEVDLMNVQPTVAVIYFLALLHDGFAKTLGEVPRSYVRMLNKSSPVDRMHKEIDRFMLKDCEDGITAFIPYAVVKKDNAHWELVHVREPLDGRDWVDVFPFIRIFTKLRVDPIAWQLWKQDVFPFAIQVEIHSVRNLGPLEPHQFACHAWAWICDKKWTPTARFRTTIKRSREDLSWDGEKHVFVVDKKDVLRIMVFETAVVGFTDVVLADFFTAQGGENNSGGGSQNSSRGVSRAGTMNSGVAAAATTTQNTNTTGGGGHQQQQGTGGGQMMVSDVEMTETTPSAATTTSKPPLAPSGSSRKKGSSPPNPMDAAAVTAVSSTGALVPSGSSALVPSSSLPPATRTVLMKKEGDMLMDHVWLPLGGVDVSGEVCISVRRVEVPRNPDEDPANQSWCTVS